MTLPMKSTGDLSLRKFSVQTEEDLVLLAETSFEIPFACVVGIYGPNGSGKTSLLRSISALNLDKKIAGEFWIGNQMIHENLSARDRIKHILYLGSDFHSPFDLTVRELLEMGATVHSSELWPVVSSKDRAQISEVIELMSLVEFLPRSFSTLSDGEKQLVMFARCLIQAPQVMVLDESFSKLDLDKLMLVSRMMKKWASRGMTFLISSHDLNFLSESSDLILLMKKSKMLCMGPVADVLTHQHILELYPELVVQIVKSPESGKNKILY